MAEFANPVCDADFAVNAIRSVSRARLLVICDDPFHYLNNLALDEIRRAGLRSRMGRLAIAGEMKEAGKRMSFGAVLGRKSLAKGVSGACECSALGA